MCAFWLVVCFTLLSKNICLANSAKQLYEIGPGLVLLTWAEGVVVATQRCPAWGLLGE